MSSNKKDGVIDSQEVEKLAQLMNKLRAEGIATLVSVAGSNTRKD